MLAALREKEESLGGEFERVKGAKYYQDTQDLFNPFKPLPNTSKFKLGEGTLDMLFKKFGFKKTIRSESIYEPYTNTASNRYMFHQIKRLNEARHNPRLYWRIGHHILRRSNNFLVIALNHCFPQWHRTLPLHLVWRIVRGYKRIVRDGLKDIKISRTYIEKANGKWRPLGVPAPEWRLHGYLLNGLLSIFLQDHQPANQHGFWKGRSPITAWTQIINEALNAPDIYEFDLKNFFPSVKLKKIQYCLEDLRVPDEWVDYIMAMSRSITQLAEEDKVYEPDRNISFTGTLGLNPNDPVSETDDDPQRPDLSAYYSTPEELDKVYEEWKARDGDYEYDDEDPDVDEIIDRVKAWNSSNTTSSQKGEGKKESAHKTPSEWGTVRTVGLPQGTPTSPLLSTLALKSTLLESQELRDLGIRVCQFADDGILYGSGFLEKYVVVEKAVYMLNEQTDQQRLVDKFGTRMSVGQYALDSLSSIAPGPAFAWCLDTEETGIEVSWEKSAPIKRNGIWLKPLKFLGLVYDPFKDELRANTRKGSKLIFDKQELMKADNMREALRSVLPNHDLEVSADLETDAILNDLSVGNNSLKDMKLDTWDEWMLSKIKGFFVSRLYSGSWDLKELEQDFNYTFVRNSWASRSGRWQGDIHIDIFNSSSIACRSLLNALRSQWKHEKAQLDPKPKDLSQMTTEELIKHAKEEEGQPVPDFSKNPMLDPSWQELDTEEKFRLWNEWWNKNQ
jgi:hypothetical protein